MKTNHHQPSKKFLRANPLFWGISILMLISFSVIPKQAKAISLASPSGDPFTAIPKAPYQVGDIIVLLVEERTVASSVTRFDRQKQIDVRSGPVPNFTRNGFKNLKGIGLSFDNEFDHRNRSTRDNSLRTVAAIQVKKILPNGYLTLETTRRVQINDEEQKVTITGIARPQDINPDNTLSSSKLLDAHIVVDGYYTLKKDDKPGFFTRMLDRVFNFFF